MFIDIFYFTLQFPSKIFIDPDEIMDKYYTEYRLDRLATPINYKMWISTVQNLMRRDMRFFKQTFEKGFVTNIV